MGLRSTRAVVSKKMRMTDSSKLLSLITERHGLVKVVAKGARRQHSRYGAAMEPITVMEVTYYHKDTRELQTVSEAVIIDSYDELKSDISLLSTASCMVEIAQTHTPLEDPSSGIFALLVESLDGLKSAKIKDADKHLWRYMLRLLAAVGYRPTLDQCIECGKKPKGRSVFFSFPEGGLFCSCTEPGERYGVCVSTGALMVMNELIESKVEDLPRLKMGKIQHSEVEKLVLQFLAYHSGSSKLPRSLSFIKSLNRTKNTAE